MRLIRSGVSIRAAKATLHETFGYSPSISCLEKWRNEPEPVRVSPAGGSVWKRIDKMQRGNWKRGEEDTGRPMSDMYPDVWDAMEDAGLGHQEAIDGMLHYFCGGKIKTADAHWKKYKREKRKREVKKAA